MEQRIFSRIFLDSMGKIKKNNLSMIEAWQGADIIGPSGFGVTNLDLYTQREDYNRNLNEFKNSKFWKDITK